ncbi:efflux RND transporter periplasmic adaptor subunit [Pedobacter antarcticus]|uniref:efflux RND transporter periplasmic adaptor subunit n=1 Tax=Pedobacter antarcticus TaxID=34086 RepID=UPI00292E88C9|nr:efflux RND transporter periplasmic adaptor subunit [Pedobacter antarcticus]
MERKEFIRNFAWIALAPSLFFAACKESSKKNQQTKQVQTYTCPMHPQIIQDKPGTCPVCGMDLVPFEKNASEGALHLNESQQALANITTITVGHNGLHTFKQLNGRLVVNPEQTNYISSRVAGRLEKLYVRQTGESIKKGQPLYQIYSEQLATLQQEYLLAAAQVSQFPDDATFRNIFKSAGHKLSLYGQSDQQIMQLQRLKKTNPHITFTAGESGTVAELSVTEGQYVSEGSSLMRLEGYQSLWVEADIYPSEAGSIQKGELLKVVIPGWENQPQQMKAEFINPELSTGAQLIQLRGAIQNPNGAWQPGLQANVFVPAQQKSQVMSLPVDAVIRDGKGAHVWIEKSKGKFEPQIVKTGTESPDAVEITTGLNDGDQVVISGAYLLYSEYILKKGKNPMTEMKM